jgi:hypothetical protein
MGMNLCNTRALPPASSCCAKLAKPTEAARRSFQGWWGVRKFRALHGLGAVFVYEPEAACAGEREEFGRCQLGSLLIRRRNEAEKMTTASDERNGPATGLPGWHSDTRTRHGTGGATGWMTITACFPPSTVARAAGCTGSIEGCSEFRSSAALRNCAQDAAHVPKCVSHPTRGIPGC